MSAPFATPTTLGGIVEGMRNAATSLVLALEGSAITLRMPAPPVPGTDTEELGLPSPEFHDLLLAPCALREQNGRTSVLCGAQAVEAALGVADAGAVEAALRSASFVQVSDRLFQVDSVERRTVQGRAYLYRIVLREPALAPADGGGA